MNEGEPRHAYSGAWYRRPRAPLTKSHSRSVIFGITAPPILIGTGVADLAGSGSPWLGVLSVAGGVAILAIEVGYVIRPVRRD